MRRMLALVAGALAMTFLMAAGTSTAAPPPKILEVYVAAGEPIHVDELDPDLGPGDWLLFRDPVLDAAGAQIGTAITRVQVIAPAGEDDLAFILDCTVELEGGRLVFSGAEQLSNLGIGVAYAVVGGTGRYAGARGQVLGQPASVDDQPATRLAFDLARP